jgi:hypothetical protein
MILNKEININNFIGINKKNGYYLLNRRFYNKNSKLNTIIKNIEYLPPTKTFLNNYHTNFVNNVSDDWIWDCGSIKCYI